MVLHDGAPHGGQSHARPLAGGLGRVERLEDATPHLLGHADARVADVDLDVRTRRRLSLQGMTEIGIQLDVLGGDEELAPLRHGVARVDGEVEEGVLDLARIAAHDGVFGAELLADADALVDGAFQYADHLDDDAVDVDARGLDLALARERQKLRRQVGRALRGDHDGVGVLAHLRIDDPAAEQVGVAHDARQHVVEVVRDAAGEMPDRVHLLGLDEPFLEGGAFHGRFLRLGDVLDDGAEAPLFGREGHHLDPLSDVRRVFPEAHGTPRDGHIGVAYDPLVRHGGEDVADRASDDLLAASSDHLLEGRIHPQKAVFEGRAVPVEQEFVQREGVLHGLEEPHVVVLGPAQVGRIYEEAFGSTDLSVFLDGTQGQRLPSDLASPQVARDLGRRDRPSPQGLENEPAGTGAIARRHELLECLAARLLRGLHAVQEQEGGILVDDATAEIDAEVARLGAFHDGAQALDAFLETPLRGPPHAHEGEHEEADEHDRRGRLEDEKSAMERRLDDQREMPEQDAQQHDRRQRQENENGVEWSTHRIHAQFIIFLPEAPDKPRKETRRESRTRSPPRGDQAKLGYSGT